MFLLEFGKNVRVARDRGFILFEVSSSLTGNNYFLKLEWLFRICLALQS